MRADDDLGGGIVVGLRAAALPGSARVTRAGFGVSPKRTFPYRIILAPNPCITFSLFDNSGFPRISQDIVKLFLQIPVRSDVTIKSFLFPNPTRCSFNLVY